MINMFLGAIALVALVFYVQRRRARLEHRGQFVHDDAQRSADLGCDLVRIALGEDIWRNTGAGRNADWTRNGQDRLRPRGRSATNRGNQPSPGIS